MFSIVFRSKTLPEVPHAARRLISASSTAVRRSKTETQTKRSFAPFGFLNQRTISSQLNPRVDATPATSTPPTVPRPTQPQNDQRFPAPYHPPEAPLHSRSSITNWILASPRRTAILLKVGDWLGYGSPKQVAGRRSKIIYDVCSEVALGPERAFWYDMLSLPPTFQSWFTITNLHVWLITVRLRALPASHGRPFVQALIDHFFLDVEDRLRAVLGKKAPERLVTRHMKIFRDQWAGLGIACDIALLTGDKDMASTMWRNLLGARGARGIAFSGPGTLPTSPSEGPPSLGVNTGIKKKTEDPSSGGVTDFEGSAIDKYVMYPQLMLVLTSYLRRELVRLECVSDTRILGGEGRGMRESVSVSGHGTDVKSAATDLVEAIKFGRVKDAARKIDVQIDGL